METQNGAHAFRFSHGVLREMREEYLIAVVY